MSNKNIFTCECGCSLFEDILLKQSPAKILPVRPGSMPEALSVCVPLMKCFKCGKIHLPDTTFNGIPNNHPDVAAHRELVSILKEKIIKVVM